MTILYFCDESSQVTDEWCGVGGIAVSADYVAEVTRDIREMKARANRKGEIKWNNADSFGGRLHEQFIDYLFDRVDQKRIHLHMRFTPMSEYDHSLSGTRRRTDTVSKSFYQLLLHRPIRFYHEQNIRIIPDDGDYTALLADQIPALHAQAWMRYRCRECIEGITPRSSASEPLLQLLDVTLGALTAYRNGRHLLAKTKATKARLSQHAFDRTGWATIGGNCAPIKRHISCWNVKPSIR